jgi:hypothetical protein
VPAGSLRAGRPRFALYVFVFAALRSRGYGVGAIGCVEAPRASIAVQVGEVFVDYGRWVLFVAKSCVYCIDLGLYPREASYPFGLFLICWSFQGSDGLAATLRHQSLSQTSKGLNMIRLFPHLVNPWLLRIYL